MNPIEQAKNREVKEKKLSMKDLIEAIKDQGRKIDTQISQMSGKVKIMFEKNPLAKISTTLQIQFERMGIKVPKLTDRKLLFQALEKQLQEGLQKELDAVDIDKATELAELIKETTKELLGLKTGTLISATNLYHQNKSSGMFITPNNKIKVPLYKS